MPEVCNFTPMRIVHAEVQTYEGVGQRMVSDLMSPAQAQNYARELAELDAKEKIGDYIKKYYSTSKYNLRDNEIIAITNIIVNIGETKINQNVPNVADTNVLMYKVILQAKIDTKSIADW